MAQIVNIQVNLIEEKIGRLDFALGNHEFNMQFIIQCPNQTAQEVPHQIVKNGHSANTKSFKQQYYCKTCKRFFFLNKCKFFTQFEQNIKNKLMETLVDGHLNGNVIGNYFHWSLSTVRRIIDKILGEISSHIPSYRGIQGKIHAKLLIIDETFLKIGKKTWYLIMVMTETGHILAVELKEHRDQETLTKMVLNAEAQLDSPINVFLSDGLTTYKGVALSFGHDLIHIRHIHQPPYGRLEISAIQHLSKPGSVKIQTLETTNDIFQNGGCFLVRVNERIISYLNPPPKKRGRKAGGKNRPQRVILNEKRQKMNDPKKRGRPKKELNSPVHVFYLNKEKGCIQAWGNSSQDAANILTKLHHIFDQKCITTNLIEKEFSILKILICFRGRRSITRWIRLINAYVWIRNNPFLLSEVMRRVSLSGVALNAALTSQMAWKVKSL